MSQAYTAIFEGNDNGEGIVTTFSSKMNRFCIKLGCKGKVAAENFPTRK